MKVEIITIGDELLIGQVVDTNSAWMAEILNDNGFAVQRKITVGDDAGDILKALEDARRRAPIVLVTGGLGPTKDDITLDVLCRHFNSGMHFSEDTYENIERIFMKRNRQMNDLTRNQAMVPDKAVIIRNEVGTAPCTWFEDREGVLISMPGVPHEMKWLMSNEVVPRLRTKFHQDVFIKHQTCWVAGYSESMLAIKLADFENNMPSFVKLAYLPQSGIIRLRLSAYADDGEKAGETVASLQRQLKEILNDSIIAEEDRNIEILAGELLLSKALTVGTAESCTGGAVASLITSVPGSSGYYLGSVVSYADEVKRNVLEVSESDLVQYGAVSRQVVEQMAKGALKVLGCDYAIATSGIAGPSGGAPGKPVGTVWIAVAGKGKVTSREYRFTNRRELNIRYAVNASLLMLFEELKNPVSGRSSSRS
ncbi:MAG: CinA family nicotinamide mononucleotide deamidase-related protein [Tannerella sp.]|jgi:nicotinamide-nucleotide amidase|nr:CinA family nicotinamide mononucleotide deamidase-related protein [Tannerella sp.]